MTAFEPVDPKVRFPELEERILARWQASDVFQRSLAQHAEDPLWIFYEGPPTANGRPGIHHVEARTFKDVYPRFKTMTGHFVRRKGGWDCHGLPVELEIEKEIGTTGKNDIEAFGIEEFNRLCRASVQRYVERMGGADRPDRLLDRHVRRLLDDVDRTTSSRCGGRSPSCTSEGCSSRTDKVTAYCPRCGTALSDAEVAMGYRTVEDPSVYLRFPIVAAADPTLVGASLAVWTTTPWTLPSNTGVAVDAGATYVEVEAGGERLLLAAPLRERVLGEDARSPSRAPRRRPRRPAVRAAVRERRGRAHGRRRRVRLDAGGDRDRAPRAGVRRRRPRGRPRAGMARVETRRRRRTLHRARPRVRPRHVREGCRPARSWRTSASAAWC